MKSISNGNKKERGAAAVEFALVLSAFLLLLIGIMEMGLVFYTYNSAVEATRSGARLAVVSPVYDPAIKDDMRAILPQLTDTQIDIQYTPDGCTAGTCEFVTVSINGLTVTPIFIPGGKLTLPYFSTTLPRESLGVH